jgi:hypothetical protein
VIMEDGRAHGPVGHCVEQPHPTVYLRASKKRYSRRRTVTTLPMIRALSAIIGEYAGL